MDDNEPVPNVAAGDEQLLKEIQIYGAWTLLEQVLGLLTIVLLMVFYLEDLF